MTNMIMGTLLAVGYLVMFWLFGALLPEKFQSGKFPVMCINGFFCFIILWFEIVAFPMKYLCCSLKQLTVIWGMPADPSLSLCNMEKTESSRQTVSGQYRAVRKRIYPCLFCCWQQ